MKTKLLFLLLLPLLFTACQPSDTPIAEEVKLDLPPALYDYSLKYPVKAKNQFSNFFNGVSNDNPDITDAGATLGRVLFYDQKLSINNTVSCGTCHHQDKAFADGKKFTEGFEGQLTTRNSKAITNPFFSNNLFWDARASSALDLTLQPVANHIEMGMEDMDFLASKLSQTTYYKDLFKDAYNSSEITGSKISDAIAQFLCSMTTFESKYDEGISSNFTNFTALELEGKKLFNGGQYFCAGCHSGITFDAETNQSYYGGNQKGAANIGLPLAQDKGLEDKGKFRIPSLRNIELTGPYMHDGRFATLDEVIDHYSDGIQMQPELDPRFKNGSQAKKFNITNNDKLALIAFLKTLTDENYVTDPKFSDPFK